MSERNKRKRREARNRAKPKVHQCPHCDKWYHRGQGHFVPPSMGEEGFWTCEQMGGYPTELEARKAYR